MLLLILLFIKHFLADFPLQTTHMISNKGRYGNIFGIQHSLYHAIGTTLVLSFFTVGPITILIGLVDGIIHYHIDYMKMKYGTKDIKTKRFWTEFGLDQLLHSLTYVFIVGLI